MPANARILLVGPDSAAPELTERLRGLGHTVCAAVPPGRAVARAAETCPDLVVANLDGDPERAGVEAAERCGAPVVCLVGAAGGGAGDLLPLERVTVPFGFVAGSFDARQLGLSIDAVLIAHERERAGRDAERRAAAALRRRIADLEHAAEITQTVFDSVHLSVVAVDTAGRFLMVNPAARRIIGARSGSPAGTREGEFDQAFGDYRMFRMDGRTPYAYEELPIARALRGESSDEVEMMVRRPGQPSPTLCVTVTGRPLRDADGRLLGAVVVTNNITRRKQTERRLRRLASGLQRQRRLTKAVLDTMHTGVVALDVRGRRLLANRAGREMMDSRSSPAPSPDEPLERRLEAYDVFRPDGVTPYPPDDLPIRRAMRGETFRDVEMYLHNAQSPDRRHLSVSGGPIRNKSGEVQAGVVVVQDVTEIRKRELELKRVATELHKHAQLMDTVFENMSDGVWVVDRTGRFTLYNKSAERLVGMGPSDVPMSAWSEHYGLFHPDRMTPFDAADLPLARAVLGGSADNVDMFVRNAGIPEGIFISVDARPLRDENGELSGGVAVARDVTQRAVADEALMQAFASGRIEVVDTILHNIGNAINSVTVGVDTIHGELQESELVERFSALADAIAAHGDDPTRWLREDPQGRQALPFVVALARDFAAQNAEFLATTGRVRERVRHIVDIIRSQKSLSTGKVERKVVELRRQITDAVNDVRESLAKRGISVEVDCARAPHEIQVHESRFNQMLVNLIRNAMDAIDARRFAAGETPRIRIAAGVDDEFLVIDVTDNGIGIGADQLGQLFTAGYTTKARGSGLGLHSAANFVIGAGGQILPLSDGVGRGATMRVMLRLSTSVPAPAPSAPPAGGGRADPPGARAEGG